MTRARASSWVRTPGHLRHFSVPAKHMGNALKHASGSVVDSSFAAEPTDRFDVYFLTLHGLSEYLTASMKR